ncbi:MAG: hypothetical protein LBE01_06425 [Deltaproteobacteria bacterium]|nr:hypothetical protein [Deltaproteobacteria bacterium]
MKILPLAQRLGLVLTIHLFFAPGLWARSQSQESLFRELSLAQAAPAQKALAVPAGKAQAAAPAAGDGPPVAVVLVPAYHRTHHRSLKTVIDGISLKSRSGTSRLGSLILTATKPVNQYFSFGWIYEYTFGEYKGGLLTPDIAALDGRSDIDLSSHMTGLFGDVFLGAAGHFNVSLFIAWDSFSGQETMISPAEVETRNLNRQDTRLGSLTIWWDKGFALSDSWELSPYFGWRTIRACVRGQNDWAAQEGTTTTQNAWSHLVSGGATLKYEGPFSFKIWGGYNRRTQKGNVPGFSSRAIAPGIANLGWMNNWDQEVWAYGLGVGRSVGEGLSLNLSYDGFSGQNALSQAVNLAVVWIF